MVTMSLRQLLDQKQKYAVLWPGGEKTMPPSVARAYRNLLAEIRAKAKRSQGVLPGIDMYPVAPKGQARLL